MYSVLFTIATLASAALASPLTKKDVHCGTTGTSLSAAQVGGRSRRTDNTADATLSDCQALTGDKAIWDAAYVYLNLRPPSALTISFNENNVCRFTNVLANVYDYAALNVACHGVSVPTSPLLGVERLICRTAASTSPDLRTGSPPSCRSTPAARLSARRPRVCWAAAMRLSTRSTACKTLATTPSACRMVTAAVVSPVFVMAEWHC